MWPLLFLIGAGAILLTSKKGGGGAGSGGGGGNSWSGDLSWLTPPADTRNTSFDNAPVTTNSDAAAIGLSDDEYSHMLDGTSSATPAPSSSNSDAAAIGLSDNEYGDMLGAAAADLGQPGSGMPAPADSAGPSVTISGIVGYAPRGRLAHYGEVHGRTGAPILRDSTNQPYALHGRTLYQV
jgi:hypothetical protein